MSSHSFTIDNKKLNVLIEAADPRTTVHMLSEELNVYASTMMHHLKQNGNSERAQ